ncbi:hypothetical protein AKJ16_DCAP23701 [Drosera capensis]
MLALHWIVATVIIVSGQSPWPDDMRLLLQRSTHVNFAAGSCTHDEFSDTSQASANSAKSSKFFFHACAINTHEKSPASDSVGPPRIMDTTMNPITPQRPAPHPNDWKRYLHVIKIPAKTAPFGFVCSYTQHNKVQTSE